MSGVRTRRYAKDGQISSDLAVAAAERALAMAGREVADVDTVIFAAASQDIAEPATANVLQEKLGCDRASVFDVKNACNSFLNGLDVAQALIQTERADCVLVATGEILSGTVKWHIENAAALRRRGAAFTLGDGGGAAVIERAHDDGAHGIFGPAEFESSGRFWRLSTVLAERVTSECLTDAGPDADMERYEMLSSVQVNAMGLIRYWRKRWEREAAASAVAD